MVATVISQVVALLVGTENNISIFTISTLSQYWCGVLLLQADKDKWKQSTKYKIENKNK